MRRLASWGSAIVLCSALACGDGGGQGGTLGDVDGDPVPMDEAPDAATRTFCTAWTECDCTTFSDRWATEAACEDAITIALEEDLADAEAASLTYDPECMGDLLALYEAFDCRTLDDLIADADDFASFQQICKVFYGNAAAGTACEEFDGLSGDSCERGLTCTDGTCTTRDVVAKGDACEPDDSCAGGTVCVPVESVTSSICAELPEAGETCLGMLDLCSFDAYCDQTAKTCAALPAAGQPCAPAGAILGGRCATGAVCDEDENCVAAPAAGEPCTDACAAGSSCEGGVCTVDAPLVCGIDFDDD
jgi:hypothetical protein